MELSNEQKARRTVVSKLTLWIRQRPCETWFALASLVFSLSLALPPFRSLASYANWTPGYYYINYWEFGFVKRGLLGTIISLAGVNRLVEPLEFTRIVHVIGLIVLSIIFWLFAHRCTQELNQDNQRKKPWLYGIFLTSPALFMHFGYDLGRVDLFGLNITLIALLLFNSSRHWTFRAATALVVTTVGLLSHEGYLFLWLPLLGLGMMINLADEPRRRRSIIMGTWLGLIILLLVVLRLWGGFEPGSGVLAQRFAEIHPSLSNALQIELTTDLKYNFNTTWTAAREVGWIGNNPAVAAYVAAITFIYYIIARENNAPWRIWVYATPVIPILFNLIAADFIRHLSCAITTAVVASLLTILHTNKITSNLNRALCLAVIAFGLLGPLGIIPQNPWPMLEYIPNY